jgi:iron complex transport system ATP-binding protein
MELLAELHQQFGKTVVMVLHDLNLAARYATHMVALKEGRVVAAGNVDQVMTEPILEDVFGIEAHIARDPRTNTPVCIAYLQQRSDESPTGKTQGLGR